MKTTSSETNQERKKSFSFEEFLRSGTFLDVKLGASRSKVIDTLGKPEAWGDGGAAQPPDFMTCRLWFYGVLEIGFSDSAVTSIGIFYTYLLFREFDPRPKNFTIQGLFLEVPTVKNTKTLLADAGIAYQDARGMSGTVPLTDNEFGWMLPSGLRIYGRGEQVIGFGIDINNLK